jgi:sulfur carrier protein ThiS
MSKWDQLKEIKGLLASIVAFAVACMAIGGALMEWRISTNVAEALAAKDLGTDSNIVAMNSSIADNKRTGEENAEDIETQRRGCLQAVNGNAA